MFDFIQSHLAKQDKILQVIAPHIALEKVASTENVFHDLVSCIIEQQIHYRSTKGTFQKLLKKAGIDALQQVNFHLFERDALSTVRLSEAKHKALMALLDYFRDAPPDFKQLCAWEVRTHLSQIKGVGKWSIDMVLIYTLNKPNVFPEDDYHLKKIMVEIYGLQDGAGLKKEMLAVAETWKPYQSIAVRYLLAWKKLVQQNPSLSLLQLQ